MATTLILPPSSAQHEPEDWRYGSATEPHHDDSPDGGSIPPQRDARPRTGGQLETSERRRHVRLTQSADAFFGSNAGFLLCYVITMVVVYFVAVQFAFWMYGPMN
jgi:hypothetical protein